MTNGGDTWDACIDISPTPSSDSWGWTFCHTRKATSGPVWGTTCPNTGDKIRDHFIIANYLHVGGYSCQDFWEICTGFAKFNSDFKKVGFFFQKCNTRHEDWGNEMHNKLRTIVRYIIFTRLIISCQSIPITLFIHETTWPPSTPLSHFLHCKHYFLLSQLWRDDKLWHKNRH